MGDGEHATPRLMPGGLRANRLFDRASGRSFTVAVDRPLMGGVRHGGPSIRELVGRAAAAEPDAIVLSPGALKQSWDLFAYRGGPAAIVRIDHLLARDFARGRGEHHRMLCSVDDAIARGADAVLVFLIDGFEDGATFADNIAAVSRVVADARRFGVPVIVESVLWGARSTDERDPEGLAAACRMAAELGADVVKTQHTGDAASMRGVIEACSVPVMVLGGAPTSDPRALVDYTIEAIEAGAAGVIFGRNVYLSEDADVIDELRNLVHAVPRQRASA
jgi:DhnA family fructose-bisphosphate aldolase class Ia